MLQSEQELKKGTDLVYSQSGHEPKNTSFLTCQAKKNSKHREGIYHFSAEPRPGTRHLFSKWPHDPELEKQTNCRYKCYLSKTTWNQELNVCKYPRAVFAGCGIDEEKLQLRSNRSQKPEWYLEKNWWRTEQKLLKGLILFSAVGVWTGYTYLANTGQKERSERRGEQRRGRRGEEGEERRFACGWSTVTQSENCEWRRNLGVMSSIFLSYIWT